MKTKENKSSGTWGTLVSILVILLLIPSIAKSEEIYKFERMWPTQQQLWYFDLPRGIAKDSQGYFYIADLFGNRIIKLSEDGQFINEWGNGSGDGNLLWPTGIVIDDNDSVFVADALNHRIQKYTSDGQFLIMWGEEGEAQGQFSDPSGVAVDASGYVYVTDCGNHRIQKYTSDGQFITSWGSEGSGDGEFRFETQDFYRQGVIAVDSLGRVYVADANNHRIQKFTSDGQFITSWGSEGSGDGDFLKPTGMTIGTDGNVYVADELNGRVTIFSPEGEFLGKFNSTGMPWGLSMGSKNSILVTDAAFKEIRKYTLSGQLITTWGSGGSGPGEFYNPHGIAIGTDGNIYVADLLNTRIQKFTPQGHFLSEIKVIHQPCGIAVGPDGDLYITSFGNQIFKFRSDGQLVKQWGTKGSEVGQLDGPYGIAIDSNENVYVAEERNHRIQKFTSDGEFIDAWGSYGSKDGEFNTPTGIAVDRSANVYVVDTNNNRIQKFTSEGQFVSKWVYEGNDDVEFSSPYGIAITNSGRIFIADSGNNRILEFTENGKFISKFGAFGSGPGQMRWPLFVAVDPNGTKVYVDDDNQRIQVFKKATTSAKDKGIIVAGGGPFRGNNLWNATQMCANFAYRTLTYQGYNKDRIYYLSADTALDLDGNGILDDVDSDATNSNLHKAITDWAKDAKDLFIYMVDHGGEGTFRMGAAELLYASDLDGWLDSLQEVISGKVILVYDACRSGSFIPLLTPASGKERIVVSSAAWDQESIFAVQGKISFSFIFWASLFNGSSFYDSFVAANNTVELTYPQSPQLDANGNGIGNEKADKTIAQAVKISSEILTGGDLPYIDEVSASKTLTGERSAVIYAKDVVDADGIGRVWAVITPPGYSSDSPETPVTDLPMVDLSSVGNDRYEATYRGFVTQGTYNIAIFAADTKGILSLPQQTEVIQTKQVYQETAPDSYEQDDSYSQANVIVLNAEAAQEHTFHDAGDQDWVKFYGLAGETYTIEASNLGSSCDAVIELYGMDGKTLLSSKDDGLTGEDEVLDWLCPAEGIYYVKVKHYDPFIFGENTEYDLQVYVPIAPLTGFIAGTITNAYSLEPIEGVRIKTGGKITALSFTDGNYLMVHPAGTYAITVEASGYGRFEDSVTVGEGGTVTKNIAMTPSTGTVATPTFSPVPGTYNSAQSVGISCGTPGATIRYTTDGSEPTESSSVYSAPIDVSVTITIKAKAFKTDWTSSATATAAYTIIFDSDSDGMPDDWEEQHGLNPLFDDSLDDADGDGFSNLREYQRQTDPDDPNSHPPRAMPWIPLLLGED